MELSRARTSLIKLEGEAKHKRTDMEAFMKHRRRRVEDIKMYQVTNKSTSFFFLGGGNKKNKMLIAYFMIILMLLLSYCIKRDKVNNYMRRGVYPPLR